MNTFPERASSLEIPDLAGTRTKRGLTPAISQEWLGQQEDPSAALTRMLAEWLQSIGSAESQFKKYVYDNDNLNGFDMRQHRGHLCALISDGEMLVMDVSILSQKSGLQDEAKPILEMIDQKIKKFLEELIEWHAPLAMQADIPESFKQAAKEVEEGKIVDLDI
jgi:hypothetical protein